MDAHAVGADQADTAVAQAFERFALEVGALGAAGFGEARGEEVDGADAFGDAVVDQAEDRGGGHGGDDVVNVVGDVGQRAVEGGAVGELAALGVEAVDALEAVEVADAAQEGLAAAPARVGGGDAGDGGGAGRESDAEGVLRVALAVGQFGHIALLPHYT